MLVKRTIGNKEQTYNYKGKEKKLTTFIQMRIEKEKKDKLIQVAKDKGYSDYSKLLRELIDSVIQ